MVLFMALERALRRASRYGTWVIDLAGVFVHVRAFAPQVVADGGPEARIDDPVHRPGIRGYEAAAHLVLALRAGLEARDAALDAELDALVVAGFEMQAVVLLAARPSSGRTAPRALQKNTAAATVSPPRRARLTMKLFAEAPAACARKNARVRYGS